MKVEHMTSQYKWGDDEKLNKLIEALQDKVISQFDGNLFEKMSELFCVTRTNITLYCPCSNGQVEWYNQLLLQPICFYIYTRQCI